MVNTANYDITIHQGATFIMNVVFLGSNGVPVNMSGYTVEAELWNRMGTTKLADFVHSWTVQASGAFKLSIPASTTSGITEQGQYDALVTEPSGDKYYLLQGTAFWDGGLTGR